jgi:hypothetical protein
MLNKAIELSTLDELSAAWIYFKDAEKTAVEARRAIEDKIIALSGLPKEFEGTKTFKYSGYQFKTVGRFSRKVDSEKLQDIAAEHGLTNYLPHLFRWSADINKAAWESADAKITTPLLGAITTTPSRPSFTITKEKD